MFLGFPPHSRCAGVLALDPVRRAPRAIDASPCASTRCPQAPSCKRARTRAPSWCWVKPRRLHPVDHAGQLPPETIECLPDIVIDTELLSATGALESPAAANPFKRGVLSACATPLALVACVATLAFCSALRSLGPKESAANIRVGDSRRPRPNRLELERDVPALLLTPF
jgi:hypothetical protein